MRGRNGSASARPQTLHSTLRLRTGRCDFAQYVALHTANGRSFAERTTTLIDVPVLLFGAVGGGSVQGFQIGMCAGGDDVGVDSVTVVRAAGDVDRQADFALGVRAA